MKNLEKYKTAEEAYHAFRSYCDTQEKCRKCKYTNLGRRIKVACDFKWLYDDDEKNSTPQWQKNILNKFTSKE